MSRKHPTKTQQRNEAFRFYQAEITKTGSVEAMQKLRTEIRGDQDLLGLYRRVRLEQNCDRRAAQLLAQGSLLDVAA